MNKLKNTNVPSTIVKVPYQVSWGGVAEHVTACVCKRCSKKVKFFDRQLQADIAAIHKRASGI